MEERAAQSDEPQFQAGAANAEVNDENSTLNDSGKTQTLYLSQNASTGSNYLSSSMPLQRMREPLQELSVSGPIMSQPDRRRANAASTVQMSQKSLTARDLPCRPKVRVLCDIGESSSDSGSLEVEDSTVDNERVAERPSTGFAAANLLTPIHGVQYRAGIPGSNLPPSSPNNHQEVASDDSGVVEETGIDPWQGTYEPKLGPLLCHWSGILQHVQDEKMMSMT